MERELGEKLIAAARRRETETSSGLIPGPKAVIELPQARAV